MLDVAVKVRGSPSGSLAVNEPASIPPACTKISPGKVSKVGKLLVSWVTVWVNVAVTVDVRVGVRVKVGVGVKVRVADGKITGVLLGGIN